jgi:hypothetical protein
MVLVRNSFGYFKNSRMISKIVEAKDNLLQVRHPSLCILFNVQQMYLRLYVLQRIVRSDVITEDDKHKQ